MTDHPTIITDSREQAPLAFRHLPSERGTLQSGDYSLAGYEHEIAIERKSIADLCQSVTRGRDRFERELHRLRGFDFARILIIGDPSEVIRHTPNAKAVFSSLSAFECRWKIPVVWESDPATAALLVERWVWFYHRERTRAHRSGAKAEPCPIPAANVLGRARAITATTPTPTA